MTLHLHYKFLRMLSPFLCIWTDMRTIGRSSLSCRLFSYLTCRLRWYYKHSSTESILKGLESMWLPVPSWYHAVQLTCGAPTLELLHCQPTNHVLVSLILPRQILITWDLQGQPLSRQGIAHSKAVTDPSGQELGCIRSSDELLHRIPMAAHKIYPDPKKISTHWL